MRFVNEKMVKELISNSEITCQTILERITVVTIVLPNGWTITKTSASVSTENYDHDYGVQVCMGQIEDEIWKLEAYRLVCEDLSEQVKRRC